MSFIERRSLEGTLTLVAILLCLAGSCIQCVVVSAKSKLHVSKIRFIDKTGKTLFTMPGPKHLTEPISGPYIAQLPGKFSEGFCRVIGAENDRFYLAYLDRNGKYLPMPALAEGGDFKEGLLAAAPGEFLGRSKRTELKYGYLDKTGKWAIPPSFIVAHDFSEGLALAKSEKTGYYGFIDHSGKFVIEPKYTFALDFSCGRALVSTGYIDRSGKLIIKIPMARLTGSFSEGLVALKFSAPLRCEKGDVPYANSKYGYIDTEGKIVIQPQFSKAGRFFDGLASVSCDVNPDLGGITRVGYVKKDGTAILDPYWSKYCGDFSDGLAYVEFANNGTFGGVGAYARGFIDRSGEIAVFPFKELKAEELAFHDGLCRTDLGYINRDGELVIKANGKHGDFSEGIAAVIDTYRVEQ